MLAGGAAAAILLLQRRWRFARGRACPRLLE